MKNNITRAKALAFMKQGYKIRHESYTEGSFLMMNEYGMIKDQDNINLGHEDGMFWQGYHTWPGGWVAFKNNKNLNRYLAVYKYGNSGDRIIVYTKSSFFNQEVIVKIDDRKITFTHCGLDYRGKVRKFYFDKKSKKYQSKFIANIPTGHYLFDPDESNDDIVTVYYKR